MQILFCAFSRNYLLSMMLSYREVQDGTHFKFLACFGRDKYFACISGNIARLQNSLTNYSMVPVQYLVSVYMWPLCQTKKRKDHFHDRVLVSCQQEVFRVCKMSMLSVAKILTTYNRFVHSTFYLTYADAGASGPVLSVHIEVEKAEVDCKQTFKVQIDNWISAKNKKRSYVKICLKLSNLLW